MDSKASLTMQDLVDIVSYGDVDENHEQLQALLDKLSVETLKALVTRATYAIDALANMPDEK